MLRKRSGGIFAWAHHWQMADLCWSWLTASENYTTFTGFDESGATTQTTFTFRESENTHKTSFYLKESKKIIKRWARLWNHTLLHLHTASHVCTAYGGGGRGKGGGGRVGGKIRTKMCIFQQTPIAAWRNNSLHGRPALWSQPIARATHLHIPQDHPCARDTTSNLVR